MSKQHCRSDSVEATFSNATIRTCLTVKFVSILSKRRNFTKNSYNIVAKNGNNVDATFDFVEKIVQLVALDNVVSTLLLVWTGL